MTDRRLRAFLIATTLLTVAGTLLASSPETALVTSVGLFCFLGAYLLGEPNAKEQPSHAIDLALREAKNEIKSLQTKLETAESQSQATSDYLTRMSHEIRTPINGIIGLTEILRERSTDEEQKSLLNTVVNSGNALINLVNDILDLSKIESGNLELVETALDLREFLSDLAQFHRPLAEKKGIEMRLDIDDRIPDHLLCDSFRLRQVITNLLGNSIKFTKEGFVSLEAKSIKISDDTATIKIAVRDTGIGIDGKGCGRLFKSFSQAESTTSSEFGGTGLGLVISQSIIERMGSKIGLESKPGKGSRFSFVIDFKLHSEESDLDTEPTPDSDYIDCLYGAKGLLADDSQVNRLTVQLQVEKLGCDLDIVENGKEALKAAKENSYDFILMDVNMPEMDGFEATRLIRQHAMDTNAKHTPIIAMTANAFSEQKEECIAAGMDDFLSKPVKREQIAEKVLLWIKHANGDPTEKIEVSSKASPRKKKTAYLPEELKDYSFLDGIKAIYDEEIAAVILEEFLVEGVLTYEAFLEAIAEGDPKKISRAAHKFKGDANIIGFNRLGELLQQFEDNRLERSETETLETIKLAFEGVLAEIRKRSETESAV